MKEVIYVGTDPNLVKYLTRLKTYKVLEQSNTKYIAVRNDRGQNRRYYASYFSTVQEWRDKQIDKLL
jgi:hypothetical protein